MAILLAAGALKVNAAAIKCPDVEQITNADQVERCLNTTDQLERWKSNWRINTDDAFFYSKLANAWLMT